MLILGVNEFLRNLRRNLLVILQIILVYAMAIFSVSAFVEQFRLYRGVSAFVDDTGLWLSPSALVSTEVYATEENLKEHLNKVEWVERVQTAWFYEESTSLLSKGDDLQLILLTSNPERASYHPPLLSGKWCESGEGKEGVIRVVVSDNFPFETRAGQEFVFAGQTFLITGVFSTQELMYTDCLNGGSGEISYLNYYTSVDDLTESQFGVQQYYMLASYEDSMREIPKDEIGGSAGPIIVDFEDDITEAELAENMNILKETFGYTRNVDAYYTNEINDYSKQLLQIKLLPMGTVFFVVLILAITCLLTSGAVSVLYEKRNYAIYFITGNNWRQTFYLSMIHWGIVAGTSLILAICACLLLKTSGWMDSYALNFTWVHVAVMAVITVVMIFLALLLPYRMLRKMQPVTILKDNGK